MPKSLDQQELAILQMIEDAAARYWLEPGARSRPKLVKFDSDNCDRTISLTATFFDSLVLRVTATAEPRVDQKQVIALKSQPDGSTEAITFRFLLRDNGAIEYL